MRSYVLGRERGFRVEAWDIVLLIFLHLFNKFWRKHSCCNFSFVCALSATNLCAEMEWSLDSWCIRRMRQSSLPSVPHIRAADEATSKGVAVTSAVDGNQTDPGLTMVGTIS